MPNKLVIFSAPSGAGKTTIVKHLLRQNLGLEFSISAASREKRPNEVHGRDYYFLSSDEFKSRIKNNEFIEWEEVYENHFYGTLKSEVDRIWNNGNSVIFDVDVIGGLNIKKQYGDKALAVFVMPPSIEELKKRLNARSTESPENLRKRIEKAEAEISFSERFDKVVVNDVLDKALNEATIMVSEFLKAK
jgi:guanylate kinase